MRRPAFVVGTLLDGENGDHVGSRWGSTRSPTRSFEQHSGGGAAPTSSAFFFLFLVLQWFRGHKLVGPESASSTQKWRLLERPFAFFSLGNYLQL